MGGSRTVEEGVEGMGLTEVLELDFGFGSSFLRGALCWAGIKNGV